MNLKDSKTKENLMRAFAGESQARNRYNMAGEAAKEQGYNIIQQIFDYTADQEKAHAKVYYDLLKEFSGENISLDTAAYPVDIYNNDIVKSLKSAQHNELEEWGEVYAEFAKTAKEEGFQQISKTFENIASIEKVHGDRFGELAQEIEEGMLYKRNEDTQWMCTHCGYIYEGKEAPIVCPVCNYPQGYYILYERAFCDNIK